jgi:hypothetical protein
MIVTRPRCGNGGHAPGGAGHPPIQELFCAKRPASALAEPKPSVGSLAKRRLVVLFLITDFIRNAPSPGRGVPVKSMRLGRQRR